MKYEEEDSTRVHCDSCGWDGPITECPPAMSIYHDICCGGCGSTNVSADKAIGDYGTDNFLNPADQASVEATGEEETKT